MRRLAIHSRVLCILGSIVPLCGGCLTQGAMQQALNERDAEIEALRKERGDLKAELEAVTADKELLQNSLQETSMNLAIRTATETAEASTKQGSGGSRGIAAEGYEDLDVPVAVRDGRLVITLPSSVAFASGKAELSSNGKAVLDKVAQRLKKDFPDARLYIEGHTDSDPISRSTFGSNRELSIARGMAVLTYLVETCRIPDDRFVVVGHGQYLPLDSNSSAEGKAKNRRVEIVVHPADE